MSNDNDQPKEEPKPEIRDRFYDAEKNPEFIERGKDADGTPIIVPNPDYIAFMGVPNRDISEEEFAALPLHIQRAIDASPVHRKTKPRPAPAPKAEAKQPEPAKE